MLSIHNLQATDPKLWRIRRSHQDGGNQNHLASNFAACKNRLHNPVFLLWISVVHTARADPGFWEGKGGGGQQYYDKNAWNMKFITKAIYNFFEKNYTQKIKERQDFTFWKSRVTYHLSHTPQHPLLGKEKLIILLMFSHATVYQPSLTIRQTVLECWASDGSCHHPLSAFVPQHDFPNLFQGHLPHVACMLTTGDQSNETRMVTDTSFLNFSLGCRQHLSIQLWSVVSLVRVSHFAAM